MLYLLLTSDRENETVFWKCAMAKCTSGHHPKKCYGHGYSGHTRAAVPAILIAITANNNNNNNNV